MKKYLVQVKTHEEEYSMLGTKEEIIKMINFSDLHDEIYKVYDITVFGKVEELKIHGVWHNSEKPLYIKVTDRVGNIVFDGYGEQY